MLEFRIQSHLLRLSHILRLFAYFAPEAQQEGSQTCNVWNRKQQSSRIEDAPRTNHKNRSSYSMAQPPIKDRVIVKTRAGGRHLISMRVFNARFPACSIPDVSRLATFLWPLRGLASPKEMNKSAQGNHPGTAAKRPISTRSPRR